MKVETKSDYRKRRHLRIRKKINGTAARPRMSVFVSNQHIYVQFIDDVAQRTVCSVSTTDKAQAATRGNGTARAQEIGRLAGQALKDQGIDQVVFDRGGFRYSGRLKALADAAREVGLKF
jgi:large subunit ribosomal protein L18